MSDMDQVSSLTVGSEARSDREVLAKLEAAKRPIRAAEVYALAMVFGLPMQALWYLPVPGEPRSIE